MPGQGQYIVKDENFFAPGVLTDPPEDAAQDRKQRKIRWLQKKAATSETRAT
jgi:hypothetical protein